MDHERFKAWRNSTFSNLLWIHGKPGSGKSHLAARVIEEFSKSPRESVMAYAYCTATQTKTRMTLNNVLGSILRQLYLQLPASENVETLLARTDIGIKDEPQRSEMKEEIRALISKLQSSIIIVDGLDECSHFSDRQFEDFCSFLKSLGINQDAGSTTKVLIFSRPDYKEIAQAFSEYPQIQVDAGANDNDIRAYISYRVDDINSSPSPEERQGLEDIKDLMFKNAGGLFLWVHFKATHFKEIGCVEDIKDALQDSPEGLDELYGEEINKIRDHPSKVVRERALRALLWVTYSYRPLSKRELLEALSMKPGRRSLSQSQRLSRDISLRAECADLISEVNGVYKLRHNSLKDFLMSKLPELLGYADCTEVHRALAETCLTYVNYQDLDVVCTDCTEELERLEDRYSLLEYAASYWGEHYSAGNWGQEEAPSQLVTEFLGNESATRVAIRILEIKAIAGMLWPSGTPTPLHILAIFGLVGIARAIPEFKSSLSVQDEFSHVPLEYAVLYGRKNMAQWLLQEHLVERQHGQTFNSKILRSCEDWLLHSVAEQDWKDEVQSLIQLGFNPNIRDKSGETPLHAAAKAGANDSLSQLLALGALTESISNDNQTPLTLAASHMNVSGVDSLLKAGARVTHSGKNGETALHHAAQYGLVDMARDLLVRGADVNAPCSPGIGFFEQTPLHHAIKFDMIPMVDLLIKRGACIESKTSCGDSPLLLACHLDRIQILGILLKEGAKIAALNSEDKSTALHIAARRGNMGVLEALLAYPESAELLNTVDLNGNTPLLAALLSRQSTAAARLLSRRPRLDIVNERGISPLHAAIDEGFVDVARLLLADSDTGGDQADSHGRTALHRIASRGLTDLLEHTLKLSTPHARDFQGETPLHYAAARNQCDFIRKLIILSPDLHFNVRNNLDLTPLHIAAREGAADAVKLFLQTSPLSRSLQDKTSKLALHYTSGKGHYGCVTQLSTPETIDCQDSSGATPLWFASEKGHLDVVQYLVRSGADVNKANSFGAAPISTALDQQYFSVAAFLLDNNAQPMVDNKGVNFLHLAALNGDEDLVRRLAELQTGVLQEGLLTSAVDAEGWDAMCYAASGGAHQMVEVLCNLQIPSQGLNQSLISPLCIAAERGHHDFVRSAISQGASVHSKNRYWETRLGKDALLYAVTAQRPQTCRVLLGSGADPTVRDCYGLCALDYAGMFPTLEPIFKPWLEGYCSPSPEVMAEAVKRSIVSFARKARQTSIKEQCIQNRRWFEISGLSKGLMLLQTQVSLEQARLCRVEMIENHQNQLICNACFERIPSTPFYQCTVCSDVDLCPACFKDYQSSKPPNTMPDHLKDLFELERGLFPVLRISETFRRYGADLLPRCFGALEDLGKEWIDERLAAYLNWSKVYDFYPSWVSQRVPGWRFLNLLDRLQREGWPDLEDNYVNQANRKQHLNHAREELWIIYYKFSPRSEPTMPTCIGHDFVEILPHAELNAEQRHHFDSEGLLRQDFFDALIKQYDSSAPIRSASPMSIDVVPQHVVRYSGCEKGYESVAKDMLCGRKDSGEMTHASKSILESLLRRAELNTEGEREKAVSDTEEDTQTVRVNVSRLAWDLGCAITGATKEEIR